MQSITGSLSSQTARPARDVLARLLRSFRTAAVVQRPAIRWAEMRPIDFQGEDTSLTQEHLDVLR